MSILIPYERLSEEQKGVIRRTSRNSGNLFVEGPPGSGKTLISLYALRDMIQTDNVKPLLLMYNHSLYGFLSTALASLGIQDNLTIATKDRFFWNLARSKEIYPPSDERYENKYKYILQKLLEVNELDKFEVTVVDEVQDLNADEWTLIKRMSDKVLSLGDFEQSVYRTNLNPSEIRSFGLFETLSRIFRFHKNIARLAAPFSSKKEDLESKVTKDSSVIPKLFDLELDAEYIEISKLLKELARYNQTIGVISPVRDRLQQLVDQLENDGVEYHYYPDNKGLRGHDFLSKNPLLITSQSAKGLEFDHVVLFGFDKTNSFVQDLQRNGKLNQIIYVSLTRTNSHLYIVRTKNTVDDILKIKVEEESLGTTQTLDDIFR